MTDDARYAIIDVSNLAYARWHTIPPQFWRDDPGTLFKALHQSCNKLQDDLCVDTLIFCFDGGYDFRKKIDPAYKQPRKEARLQAPEDEKELRQILFDQIAAFREIHLPTIGAKNIFWAKGFEADDLIASCVLNLPKARKVYIVSNDEDLYQMIEGSRVVVYRPTSKTIVNEEDFRRKHSEMPPCLYASAKAWAGCSSDNVVGLTGIGMAKAAKFLMGKGNPEFRKRFTDSVEVYNKNIQLTKLPAPQTPACRPVPQDVPLDWSVMGRVFDSIPQRTPKGIKK